MKRQALFVVIPLLVSFQSIAEQLAIPPQQADAILEKTVALEKEIQQRQLPDNAEMGVSRDYQAGYNDGYNKAVLDLVKSKLLNDPSIKPSMIRQAGATGVWATSAGKSNSSNPKINTTTAVSSPVAIDVAPTATVSPIVVASPQTGSAAQNQAVQIESGTHPEVMPQVTSTAWLQKANQSAEEKNWSATIDAASEAINVDPQLLEAYVLRSWAYAERGQLPAAIGDVDIAIALNPEFAPAYNNRAYAYEIAGKSRQAVKDYKAACDMHYEPACETLRKLNEIAAREHREQVNSIIQQSFDKFQQRDWKSVVALSNEVLKLDMNNITAYANRAGAYTEMGLFDKALDDCNQALIIDPNFGVAYNNKGYAYELMGKRKKAILEYETACVLGVQQSCQDFTRLTGRQMSKSR